VVEIYGPESGKTTLTQVIAEMRWAAPALCRRRARAGHSVRPKAGVNLQELLISQPDTGEQALEM
jgi:RecA/RadA recombinase